MKNLQKLGKILNKNEQKEINGGRLKYCECDSQCPTGQWCCSFACTTIASAGYCPSMVCPTIVNLF